MRKFFLTGFIILLSVNAAYGSDKEEYIMGDISTLPVDFYLNVEVSTDGNVANIADRVCTFRISREGGSSFSSFYDISLFNSGEFVRMYQKQPLPFTLKRNYRGIKDGDYRITFVARDEAGNTGRGSVIIRVRH